MNRRDLWVGASLVLTTLVWGSAFTAIKVVVRVLDPVDLAVVRFLIAGVGFIAIITVVSARDRGRALRNLGVRSWIVILACGVTGVAGYHVSLNVGEQWLTQTASEDTAAILSGFLISTNTIFTVLLTPLTTREALGPRRITGILVSLVGTAVLVLWGRGVLVDRESLAAILLVLAAPLSWAVYTVLTKKFLRAHHPLLITSLSMLAGTLILLPFSSPTLGIDIGRLGLLEWGWILLLGLGATLGGYLAWGWALSHWDATRVSTFVYLVPLFGVVVATIVENERLTAQIALGGALILAGLYVANSVRPARAAPAVPASPLTRS